MGTIRIKNMSSVTEPTSTDKLVIDGDNGTKCITVNDFMTSVFDNLDYAQGYFSCGSGNVFSTDFIEYDNNTTYDIGFYCRGRNGYTGGIYFGLVPYDEDKKQGHLYNVYENRYNQNDFQLTQDLKSGDTKIYLSGLANWKASTVYYQRWLAFWDYKSYGKTYSQNVYKPNSANAFADSDVNATEGYIQLKQAYSGVTHAKGTYVSQMTDGSTACYVGQSGVAPSAWAKISTTSSDFQTQSLNRLKYAKYVQIFISSNGDWSAIKLTKKGSNVNLVKNGFGEYLDNTNFSGAEYVHEPLWLLNLPKSSASPVSTTSVQGLSDVPGDYGIDEVLKENKSTVDTSTTNSATSTSESTSVESSESTSIESSESTSENSTSEVQVEESTSEDTVLSESTSTSSVVVEPTLTDELS